VNLEGPIIFRTFQGFGRQTKADTVSAQLEVSDDRSRLVLTFEQEDTLYDATLERIPDGQYVLSYPREMRTKEGQVGTTLTAATAYLREFQNGRWRLLGDWSER
jgi:hypothetical protein